MQEIIYKKQYSEYVTKYSKLYDVNEDLVYAVVKAESNFNKDAKSNKGAIGLMQIMKDTANDIIKMIEIPISEEDLEDKLFEPETNINLGTKYLSILLKRYDCAEVAIAAYNAGIGTVDNWIEKGVIKSDGIDIENIPYKETNNYVRKVLRNYKIYEKLSAN